jgi:cytochrome b561
MQQRERTAWAWIAALVVVFGVYFGVLRLEGNQPQTFLHRIALLAIALSSLGVLALLAHFFRRERDEDGALVAPDERDLAIDARATTFAYYVLMAGLIVVGCVMPFRTSGWDLVHAALLSIAAAEIVRYALVVHGYRRDA